MMTQVSQLQAAQEANALRQLQAQQLMRAQEQENALRSRLSSGAPMSFSEAAAFGAPGLQALTAQRAEIETQEKRQADKLQDLAEGLMFVRKDPSLENFSEAFRLLKSRGLDMGSTAAEIMLMGPEDRKKAVDRFIETTPGMSKRLLELDKIRTETEAARVKGEAAASQAATAAAKLPFERQRAEAAALQATTAADKAAFERANPGFTIQETDQGLFKVNKRTGEMEPLMFEGAPVKAPERRPLVQVTPGESAFNQAIGTGLGRQVVKDLEAAQTAPSIANRANSVLTAIDQNKAFVGPASEFKLQLARALNVTGKGPSEQIAATETLIADLKQAVIDAIKASNLGTGNGFTNKDLDFLVKAKAADIANDPKTLAEFARRAYLTAEEAAKLGTKIVENNEQVKRQYQGRSFEVPPMFQSSGKSGVRRGTAAAAEDGGRREIAPGVFVTERP
jgi:hypothetical protein